MRSWATAAVAALIIIAAACDSPGSAREGVASVEQGFPIGILLPDWNTSRYETFDRPLLTQRLKELCPQCEVLRYRPRDARLTPARDPG
jgi:D-xylose transport system substrate-binding protein